MMKHRIIAYVVWGLLLVSCGNRPASTTAPSTEKVQLLLFSAPPCENCGPELQKLDTLVPQELGDRFTNLEVKVFVEQGDEAGTPPTQESTDRYKATLGIHFNMVMDPWQYTTYKKYKKGGLQIPAAVVLREQGSSYAFTPGTKPEAIVAYLKSISN